MYKKVSRITCRPKFSKQCPVSWDTLTALDDTEDRWCTLCKKQVHRTDDPEKLKQLAQEGKCVAVLYHRSFDLGLLDPTYPPADQGKLVDHPIEND